ncbi:DUF2306 domain-containing protein [Streptomyces sp. NBC_00669]|uniref:DUF2306 domain-containing protein n=1 Tax=Streptomyces sp. NBC_00669 TaxID=2976011 RepID=UPI002E34C316|nr:DUF2306 domain-containing protein [Streptomyces sp. NBC_00669]
MASTEAPSHRRAWALFVVATAAGAGLVSPYVTFHVGSGRLDITGRLHWYVLVVHIFAALVALVLGPLQFIPAIRARRPVHRAIGRGYLLAGVLPAALAAVPVALLSGRLLTQVGLTVAAAGWLVTGHLALRAARRRDFEAHRSWMARNYAFTFLAVTARVVVPLLLLAQLPFRGTAERASFGNEAHDLIPVGQTLGWIVDLAVAEVLIRRRRARSAHT